MKVAALMENTPYRPEYVSEHGLSLYIETKKHKILFDTGQTGDFTENADRKGIDLSAVDLMVLSHGHYDHSGGLKKFLECNQKAPVYVNEHVFGEYYHGTNRYIGVDSQLKQSDRLILTGNYCCIDDEVSLCTCNEKPRPYPADAAGLTEKTPDGFVPDAFLHEQYMMLFENGKTIVFSGCSHKGILNILSWLPCDVFIGGFHLMDQDLSSGKNDVLDQTAAILNAYSTEYYTCHCTGTNQYEYLKERLGEKLHYLASGQEIRI